MRPDRGPFDARLQRAVRAEAARFQPITDAAPIEDALAKANRRRVPIAIVALPALVLTIALAIRTAAPSVPGVAADAPLQSPSASVRPATAPPIGLADCHIAPPDSSLAFAGWSTLDVLGVRGGKAASGQPIYAVITRGLAEWVGWQEHYSGPMFPAPIGRMGCIYDPSTGESSLVGVPLEWEPPPAVRGSPDALAGGQY